ncbi:hypothetical protein SRB5_14940 [Streptomyces sp. RB5]|uniref:DUF732 domain-containing protein n=1 Tax=Streptomyces smaragdinus TaxID=2585196 RepID=A0A7K0CD45_9ACTN|nr:hypothetical protein [Streptomyces smaragdinus]MQY11378.1 hypothetical protein [Streptomyces smaragdinus]
MRTTTAVAGAAIALLLALTGCSGDNGDDTKAEPTKSAAPTPDASEPAPTADPTEAPAASPEPKSVPKNATREELLAALIAISPAVVGADENKTIAAAHTQCAAINSGAPNLDRAAAANFAQGDTAVTEEQGKAINEVLKASGFCEN